MVLIEPYPRIFLPLSFEMFELVKLLVEAVHLFSVVTLHALFDEVGFLINPDLISFSQMLSLTLEGVFFKISFLVRLLV